MPTTSSSSSATGSSSNQPAVPLSIDGLLALHASAQNPPLAALDQAVSERNLLSSQNSQLWKLIEKQRAGYNQILKELERVRNERDTYKARLSVAGASSSSLDLHRDLPQKRQSSRDGRERERAVTLESPAAVQDLPPRKNMTRYNSDDIVTPRSSGHPNSLTQSQSRSHSQDNSSSSQSPANTPSRQKSPLAPLVVPPRAEPLPQLSATQENPPPSVVTDDASSQNSGPKYSHYTHGYSDSIMSSMTSSSSTAATSPYPRKSSVSESIRSVSSNASALHPHHAVSEGLSSAATYNGGYPSSQSHHQRSEQDSPYDIPQSAPPLHSNPDLLLTPQTATPPPEFLHPQASLATPTAASLSYSTPNSSSSLAPPSVQAALSRDSRITLPDEARQYIANMVESPIPSPKVDAFTPRQPTQLSASTSMEPPPPSAGSSASGHGRSGEESEFLDFDDEDADVEEGSQEAVVTNPFLDTNETVNPEMPPQPTNPPSLAVPPPPPPQIMQTNAPPVSLQPGQNDAMLQATPRKSNSHAPTYDSPQPLNASPNPSYQYQYPNPARTPQKSAPPQQNLQASMSSANGPFRALPLLSTDLPHTKISVSHSFVRPNDRGKEVLSFIVHVDPGRGKEGWKVEKMYSHVLNLDQRVRASVAKGVGKKIAVLPEGKLWKDHAPAKVDQRKAVLENYLQTLINLPVKTNDEVVAFFTTDIVKETMQPVMQAGYKEGYLTKRGKNFGGWKTRFFVLQGPVLEYYDCRGGTHLGSINVAGAQIGRQQRNSSSASADDEKEYRHAFLIVEAKKGPGGNHPRHVLCAESDEERDSWVEILVRYFSGAYSEEPVTYGPSPSQPRPSTSNDAPTPRKPIRAMSRDDIPISKGPAMPLSQLPQDANNAKFFQGQPGPTEDLPRSSSPSKPVDIQQPHGFSDSHTAKRILERGQGQPSSLPDSSPLSSQASLENGQRSNSELGHYPDLRPTGAAGAGAQQQQPQPHSRHRSPERHRRDHLKQYPHINTVDASSSPTASSPSDREPVPSPEKDKDPNGKMKISGPLNGAPIPAGHKFGGKDPTPEPPAPPAPTTSSADRREKAKSRGFWGFGKMNNGVPEKPAAPAPPTFVPRAVFGVALEESLDVAQIANLPAIVFRCIQYLEAKKADQEEGIYRLSGSSAVIKSLKDRFNVEGDIDLIASDEYWDPHAIAGLLKSYLRELPASILTRDLHVKFLSVIDFVDPQERIRELSHLIAALPIANYSLLRALTAHLILIVQNSTVNKMTMRNVGIVFSPTLGIPAGVFSLMLGEFNRVFNVDGDKAASDTASVHTDKDSELDRRNSKRYSEAAADQLLGLSGRTLKTPAEESQSDTDDLSSLQEESSNEADVTHQSQSLQSSARSSPSANHSPPDTPLASKQSKASSVAASKGLGLSVETSTRGNRHSRMIGLPHSPRPPHSPASSFGQ
ncbi:Rho GTPase activating protein [Marasmius crinis-equi]|uniref:Rho GTPase activating protein n=1 Tax=Marasmius crinis-equi TaxID=585013 RepID=A0ABR3FUX1_9AGAR